MSDQPVAHPCGSGFTYTYNDRPWTCSNRCRLCGEFGHYDDTRRCNDCEQEVLTAVAEARRDERQGCRMAASAPRVTAGFGGPDYTQGVRDALAAIDRLPEITP